MEEELIPLKVHPITPDDKQMILALISGAGWSVIKKVYENELAQLYRQIDVATEVEHIFRLQGRIQGVRWAMNYLPMLIQDLLPKKAQEPIRKPVNRLTVEEFLSARKPSGQLE